MRLNSTLNKAKKQKRDEFYTRIEDIIAEIGEHKDYHKHFKDKVVYLNCDSEKSAFWQFFKERFHELGLKKLIATHWEKDGSPSYKLEWSGELLKGKYTVNMIKTPLKGDGDFRSDECVEILKEADIVVTNPPFSLFREYLAQLMQYQKKFLVIGNINGFCYKDVFPLIKNGKVWFGYKFNGKKQLFIVPNDYHLATSESGFLHDGRKYIGIGSVCWYTNVELDKQMCQIELTKTYYGHEDEYPKYDYYDAIECWKVNNIPKDYYGVIGVPITYIGKHCPEQFEIVGELCHGSDNEYDLATPVVNGVQKYKRILIKRK